MLADDDLHLDDMTDGDMLPSNGGYSIAQFIKSRESDFLKSNPAYEPGTMKFYYQKLSKMNWLRTPEGLKQNPEKINRSTKDGMDALFAYLEKWNDDECGGRYQRGDETCRSVNPEENRRRPYQTVTPAEELRAVPDLQRKERLDHQTAQRENNYPRYRKENRIGMGDRFKDSKRVFQTVTLLFLL